MNKKEIVGFDKRLRLLIEDQKISIKEFANIIGTSDNTLYVYLRSERNYSETLCRKVLKKYTNVSKNWLVYQIGEMYIQNTELDRAVNAPQNSSDYLQRHLETLEANFKILTQDIESKNRIIEKLMGLLGKPKGVSYRQIVPSHLKNRHNSDTPRVRTA